MIRYVVFSGLPGSGKSTLARRLAARLERPVLDKDDILSTLFESLGAGDEAWRTRLSRNADDEFCRRALELGPALLVSWWRHPNAESTTGTPTAWLATLPSPVVEIHCECPPDVAADRFARRRRHPGHLDAARAPQDLVRQLEQFAPFGPLGCGPVLRVGTDGEVELEPLVAFIHEFETSNVSDPIFTMQQVIEQSRSQADGDK